MQNNSKDWLSIKNEINAMLNLNINFSDSAKTDLADNQFFMNCFNALYRTIITFSNTPKSQSEIKNLEEFKNRHQFIKHWKEFFQNILNRSEACLKLIKP